MKASTFREKLNKSFVGMYEDGKIEAEFDLVDFAYRGLKTEIIKTGIKKVKITKNKITIVLGKQIN
jgi:hypothetical protein